MGLEKLEQELKEHVKFEIIFEQAPNYDLDEDNSPANTFFHEGSYKIYILETLLDNLKKEAIAHELAHLYTTEVLKVYSFKEVYSGEVGDIKQAINNVVQHPIIEEYLFQTHGIESNLHKNCLSNRLKQIIEDLKAKPQFELRSDEELTMAKYSLDLLDIGQTLNNLQVIFNFLSEPFIPYSLRSYFDNANTYLIKGKINRETAKENIMAFINITSLNRYSPFLE